MTQLFLRISELEYRFSSKWVPYFSASLVINHGRPQKCFLRVANKSSTIPSLLTLISRCGGHGFSSTLYFILLEIWQHCELGELPRHPKVCWLSHFLIFGFGCLFWSPFSITVFENSHPREEGSWVVFKVFFCNLAALL